MMRKMSNLVSYGRKKWDWWEASSTMQLEEQAAPFKYSTLVCIVDLWTGENRKRTKKCATGTVRASLDSAQCPEDAVVPMESSVNDRSFSPPVKKYCTHLHVR